MLQVQCFNKCDIGTVADFLKKQEEKFPLHKLLQTTPTKIVLLMTVSFFIILKDMSVFAFDSYVDQFRKNFSQNSERSVRVL